ncbi:hypothetical protein [Luminiphilus syltensis]|uniref:hypothetical protein n=1 Tax=Luminiphilus syltensis TaxID=1341119 RepID=UPI0012B62917|nr:hypothetical protein [Luminiphilus syltensis]
MSDLDTVDGATIHLEDAIDTIIGYLAKGRVTNLEPVDIHSGPNFIQQSLERRLQALSSSSPLTPEAQEEAAEIEKLLETAAKIRRDFAIAADLHARGEQTGLLRIHRVEDPSFPDDIYADKLITDSVYRWALDTFELDINEWAPLGKERRDSEPEASKGDSDNGKQEVPNTEIAIAQRVLADLIRQFMLLACPRWKPGQPTAQRPTSKFLRNGNLAARPLAAAIVKDAIDSTAEDDSEGARRQIGIVLALIEGQGGPSKAQTEKALPGYYRTIYWTATAIDARLRKNGGTTTDKTDETDTVFRSFAVFLSIDRQHKIVDDDTLRRCLEIAVHKRLKDP